MKKLSPHPLRRAEVLTLCLALGGLLVHLGRNFFVVSLQLRAWFVFLGFSLLQRLTRSLIVLALRLQMYRPIRTRSQLRAWPQMRFGFCVFHLFALDFWLLLYGLVFAGCRLVEIFLGLAAFPFKRGIFGFAG